MHPKSATKSKDATSSDLRKEKSASFKQFDIVDNYTDHHFANNGKDVLKMSKAWTKKIQQEWKILEKDLPETIFVRVYETRMDLLRAVIIGPAGTPYHDGLFFFDFHFTAIYPNEPPKVYYHSGGLRLNPNLYANGKVCLSLLDTWHGTGCEKWDPQKSTMLQVLVSIQGLVLNARPYFNEPGYGWTSNTFWGKKNSLAYNEATFLLSCKTMLYSLQKPPKNFEDFVAEHFRSHGNNTLLACRAYMNGTQIGFAVKGAEQPVIKGGKVCSANFKAMLEDLVNKLLKEFMAKGADCEMYKQLCSKKPKVENASSSVNRAGTKDLVSRKAVKSKLKRLGQYLMKLGKKVLPIET